VQEGGREAVGSNFAKIMLGRFINLNNNNAEKLCTMVNFEN